MKRFAMVWAGQLVSVIGSALTAFVLGVWVYLGTGSVTQFVLIQFCAVLPGILLAPYAGAFADRYDRKKIMLFADTGAGVVTVFLLVAVSTDSLAVWQIYVASALTATLNSFHIIAYQALVPSLVPPKHLGRINGFMQITQGVQIAAPLVAGALLGLVGLRGVLVIDIVTMVFAVGALLAARLPVVTGDGAKGGGRDGIGAGLKWLRGAPGLFTLCVVFGVWNFLFAIAGGLVQPLILSFSGPATLGVLMAAGGSGLFIGGLVMGAWGGPKRRVQGIYLGLGLGGVFLVLHSLAPSPWLIGIAAPAFLFTLPLMNTCCVTLLQTKVDPAVLGRVLAVVRMISTAAMPIAFLLIGPLSDGVAEPLMAADGALASTVGALIGTGDGRGIALIFLVVGVLMFALTAFAWSRPRLRAVDDLPDPVAAAPERTLQ
ncbi:MFS transporter [Actinosynnema sp. NPDC047251]|uniref:Permease, MFS-type n=1 Tax=Saccharothrix espanaensis (strain ATCC 51144 / DSM 44229 / JCM 9112 / NBRC 15066 / NRRL 15764) TaxID=1179773 RepID=K0JSX0_SACES|nr:MFS transporter [Saccharothrix espanaensis]CCH30855.1 Permease, MFS-type [Saccharothrix espanaensis DSM 44229]